MGDGTIRCPYCEYRTMQYQPNGKWHCRNCGKFLRTPNKPHADENTQVHDHGVERTMEWCSRH